MRRTTAADREAVLTLLSQLSLDSIDTEFVAAEKCVDAIPDAIAIGLENQPAKIEHRSGRLVLRYAHRATYFPEGLLPPPETPKQPVDEEARVGRVEAVHVVTWRCADPLSVDDATLAAFAEADAYFMVYPYVRQTLQSLSEQVSLPPVILPLLNRAAPSE